MDKDLEKILEKIDEINRVFLRIVENLNDRITTLETTNGRQDPTNYH